MILRGEKILEFRRSWAVQPVSTLVIYASSPMQRIVAIANVRVVHTGSPTSLWNLSRNKPGGITRQELYAYFKGRATGFAIEIALSSVCKNGINPKTLFRNFRPPQSFCYLKEEELAKVVSLVAKG